MVVIWREGWEPLNSSRIGLLMCLKPPGSYFHQSFSIGFSYLGEPGFESCFVFPFPSVTADAPPPGRFHNGKTLGCWALIKSLFSDIPLSGTESTRFKNCSFHLLGWWVFRLHPEHGKDFWRMKLKNYGGPPKIGPLLEFSLLIVHPEPPAHHQTQL